jgi:hypothetical protein
MNTPNKQITPERKALYYGGIACTVFGLLLFLSTFVTGAMNFGNFENFEGRVQSEMCRAIGGMILMMAGGFMMKVGAQGLAGSGVILDPEKARKDVEPWSRMTGGVVQDTVSEIDIVKKVGDRLEERPPQIKVRCPKCQALNDETAKFCNQCGASI